MDNKEFKRADFFKHYLGCDVQFGYEGHKKNGQLVGKDKQFGWQVLDYFNVLVPYQYVRDELITLKLRPLSDMNREEAEHFAWMCLNSRHHLDKDSQLTEDEIQFELVKNDDGTLLDDDVEIYIGCTCRCWEGAILIKKDGSIQVYDDAQEKYESVDDIAFKVHYLLSKSFDLFGLIQSGNAIVAFTN